MKRINALLVILIMTFLACNEEPVEVKYLSLTETRGVFISCEGNFMYGNASLSFYDIKNRKVYNQVYFARNQAPLGDVAQSMAVNGDNLYIVVNNSGKVVVADKNTLEYKGAIKGLQSPREIHIVSNTKAYISDMTARKITVVDPETYQIKGYIGVSDGKANSTGHSTENFVQVGDFVFVTCWVSDNQVLVIDTKTDAVVDSIQVPFQPNKIVVDCKGKIWVQTDGEYYSKTGNPEKPALVRIDPGSRKVENILWLNPEDVFFTDIRLNPAKDSLLYIAGDLYSMPVFGNQLPDKGFISAHGRFYYSFGIDPVSGDIYLGDPIDYSQNGLIYRYSNTGTLIDTFRVGICPGDYLFNF